MPHMPSDLPMLARLPLLFDAARLQAALAALPAQAWQAHFNTGYYEGEWSGVPLLTPVDAPTPLAPGTGEPQPGAQCDAFWQAQLARFEATVRSARLLRLGPGARIREHRDYDLGLSDGDLRLHVPIATDERVEFLLDGRRVPMQPGECWFLDLSLPHRVDNFGGQARIHLVLDCRRSPWLLAQITAGLADTPPCLPGRGAAALAAFRAHVHADPQLEASLAEHEDPAAFVEAALALAQAAGFRFGREDLQAAMAEGRRAWRSPWRA
jgi:hypothetical protein